MRSRRRRSPTITIEISSVHPSSVSVQVQVRIRRGRGRIKTTSHLRPVDIPNQVRARNERLISHLRLLIATFCRRHRLGSTRHRYRLQSRYDRLDKVRPEPVLIQRGRDEVGECHRRDLAFFFDGVHVHSEAELIVAVAYVSII
jgi:hypothetical protein